MVSGILAISGIRIPGSVVSWFAVVVLPINAAINPVLYTISEIIQKRVSLQEKKNMYLRALKTHFYIVK